MNKKQLEIQRSKTRNKYMIRGGNYYSRRAVNGIYFNPSNSWAHEKKKAEICYGLLKEKKKFITEAQDRKTKLIRDIVVLDDDSIIEVETTEKRAKRHGKEITVERT